jgi:hypothetical protein
MIYVNRLYFNLLTSFLRGVLRAVRSEIREEKALVLRMGRENDCKYDRGMSYWRRYKERGKGMK